MQWGVWMKISAALIQLWSQNTQPSLTECLHMPERAQILVSSILAQDYDPSPADVPN